MTTKKKYYYVADILRAIAALLVLNSHYGNVYPIKLSIGAELGVAIFFILSGFLLSSINTNTKFIPWIIKKELRLFVPYYLWKIVRLLFNHISVYSFNTFLSNFLSPTGIWFSIWISVLYVVYYVYYKYVYKKWGKKSILLLMGLSFIAFVVFYCTTEMHESSMETSNMPSKMLWLLCMMLGLYIHESDIIKPKKDLYHLCFCAMACVVLYGVSKLVINRGYIPYLKCMPTIIAVIASSTLIITLFNYEEYNKNIVASISSNCLLHMVSCSSLEIWYVSWLFIGTMSGFVFPVNWISITIATILVAYILHKLSEMLISVFYKSKT